MATTSAAVAGVKSAVANAHPPSSPFAELLRRSRFASFDSQIRQTYYSPPSYAHRGNWGLKRPLALRRRNAFIAMPKSFDDRAQYAEWDNAENEVRFIRRFEEMEVRPQIRKQTPWHRYLGSKNSEEWLLDSEFCERHEGPEAEEQANAEKKAALEAKEKSNEFIKANIKPDLSGFGNSGQGNYGHRGSAIQANQVALSPNLNAMSPRQFQRYLKRLRELRPKFIKFLESNPEWKGKSTYELSQSVLDTHFRRFLEHNTAESFADVTSGDIEQRPHPVGGLLYTHPSTLHSQLFSKPQPGIVLSGSMEKKDNISTTRERSFVASFAGMSPVIRQADWQGRKPLLDHGSEEGIKRENLAQSVATMRLKPSTVYVEQTPRSVGTLVRGLMGTRIVSEAVVDMGRTGFNQTNPYRPGTMEYSGMKGPTAKGSVETENIDLKRKFDFHTETNSRQNSKHTLTYLANMFAN